MQMTALRTAPTVLIRAARGSDGSDLVRLAALDSSKVPAGDVLVAETDGRVIAAIDSQSGAAIADPFQPTADVVALLELRAQRLNGRSGRRSLGARLGLRPAPRARAA
jgi:hypothetical protein